MTRKRAENGPPSSLAEAPCGLQPTILPSRLSGKEISILLSSRDGPVSLETDPSHQSPVIQIPHNPHCSPWRHQAKDSCVGRTHGLFPVTGTADADVNA